MVKSDRDILKEVFAKLLAFDHTKPVYPNNCVHCNIVKLIQEHDYSIKEEYEATLK